MVKQCGRQLYQRRPNTTADDYRQIATLAAECVSARRCLVNQGTIHAILFVCSLAILFDRETKIKPEWRHNIKTKFYFSVDHVKYTLKEVMRPC